MAASWEVGEAVAPAAALEVDEGGWKEDPQEAATGHKEVDEEDRKRETGEGREEEEKEVAEEDFQEERKAEDREVAEAAFPEVVVLLHVARDAHLSS